MRIEAVIVCKDYSDFLEQTLDSNLTQLDEVVVVTGPEDFKTQELCRKLSVYCVPTTVFYEDGDPFNKGKGIRLGFAHLPKREWLLHLDADIFLPRDFRRLLARAALDVRCIYGADRINVYGYESWMKLKPLLSHGWDSRWFLDPEFCHKKPETEGIDMRMGARVLHEDHGYIPIGFFQLWHASQGKNYPRLLGSAAGSDCIFPTQWPRENRRLLPDVVVYHLDSETQHGIGTNWKGRRSRPFAPAEKKTEVKQSKQQLTLSYDHHHHHHHHGGRD